MNHSIYSNQSRSNSLGSQPDSLSFSKTIFRLRKTLVGQVSSMEHELERKFKERSEHFVSKEELHQVIEKIHGFKDELESMLVKFESSFQHTSQSFKEAAVHMTQIKQEQANKHDGGSERDDLFSNLNVFNLRRKYHEFSLRLRSEEVDPFGYDPIFDQFLRPFFDFLFFRYWRVTTTGMEFVPNEGSCLFVGNHSGTLPYDATMLKMAMIYDHPKSRDLRFMVEDFLFHFPFLGTLMNRFGGVRASQENAETLLKNDMPVIVFPEGVKGLGKLYKDRYKLARFGRGGFIKLCLRTKAKLLPTAFIGPEEIHPMLYRETFLAGLFGVPYLPVTPTLPWLGPVGLLPLPAKWSIHILGCMDFSQYEVGAEKDRVLVAKLTQDVRDQIQAALDLHLKERKSIWF